MNKSQVLVKKFSDEREWGNLPPSDLAKSISIEAAELLEVFQWSNLSVAEIKSSDEKYVEFKDELADVLIYCMEMTNVFGLDSDRVVEEKLDKASKKYPVELMRRQSKKEPHAHDRYLKIKKEYRLKKKQ